jgi:sugar lactone lactonase YvrE
MVVEALAMRVVVITSFSLLVACGGAEGGRESSAGGDGLLTMSGGTADSGEDVVGTAGDVDGSGGGSSDPTADGTAGNGSGVSPKFDVGSPDGDATCGGGMGAGGPLSYIWIANSPQGSVSKIDTQSMIEQGRYLVRPDSAGSPSRTSVSLSGDVAVANRLGGVTKIYGNTDDCVESNGVAGIQTSTGGADILPWGTEECVAWHTPLAYSSNRPMAWAQGDWNAATCSYVDEKLWTAGASGSGTTQVLLMDGETGVVEQTVNVPEIASSIGLYGGAVDGDGHFWGIETGGPRLLRVDRDDFTYQVWNGPGVASYGIAVDSVGRPWFCAGGGASRFDPVAQTWQTLPSPGGNAWGGCMTDGMGTLWHCRQQDSMLVGIDTETLTVTQQVQLPAYAHGISVDFDGYVWAVGFTSTQAYRVDPALGTYDTFDGLVGAYTYSDMTGFALSSAGVPSG